MEEESLTAVLGLLRAPQDRMLARMSTVLADLVPHEGLVLFTGDCLTRTSLLTYGLGEVNTDELGSLAEQVDNRQTWHGRAVPAGIERPVFAVAVTPPETAQGFLVIALPEREEPAEPSSATARIVGELVELVTAHQSGRPATVTTEPVTPSPPPAIVHEITEAHAVTLTALLGVLRATRLDDATARRMAVDLAVPALIEARAGGERSLNQESAAEAFATVAGKLDVLTRYHDIVLELDPPRPGDRLLPGSVARAARAMVRTAVLAMLQQGEVGRIRLAWQVEDARLVVNVRDDGPGTVASDALCLRGLHDWANDLHGTLTVDSLPHWGTTIIAVLPLSLTVAPTPPPGPLDALNPRERDVLEQIARGHRNRLIAGQLGISENTVKFHVANILSKLGVTSRGEAAALALRQSHSRHAS